MIICDKTTMNAAIIFIALSWFAIGYVVANARMINQAIEKGLAYRDSEGRFCWKEYYQLKCEFEESKKND